MKLTRVKIHNFRAVLDQEFALKDYGLLVGPNKSGKSTVIETIRAVRNWHAQLPKMGHVKTGGND